MKIIDGTSNSTSMESPMRISNCEDRNYRAIISPYFPNSWIFPFSFSLPLSIYLYLSVNCYGSKIRRFDEERSQKARDGGFFRKESEGYTLMDTLSPLMALLRGIRRWRAGAYRALQNAYDATADDFIEAKETCWKKCYCDAPVYLCVRSLINSNNSGAPRGSSHFPQLPSPRIPLLTRIEFARTFDDHAIKFTRNE